jgi:NAD(P)-dependent dehydrogenase (short-subunit alcohol dehydrogenase family)
VVVGLLKKSASGRIVFTGSIFAFINTLSLKNLNVDCPNLNLFDIYFTYSNSKLSMIMAADTFAEKLKGTGVTVNSVHPWFVKTPIFPKTSAIAKNVFFEILNWLNEYVIGRVSNW